MCDRCRTIQQAIETRIREVKDQFPTDIEHHIADAAARDPHLDTNRMRQAFASVGANYHVAMALARVAVEEVLEANRFDTIRASDTLMQMVGHSVASRQRLLQAEPLSGHSSSGKPS